MNQKMGKNFQPSFLLWWATLINHLALMLYLYFYVEIDWAIPFSQKISLILLFFVVLLIYGFHLIRFKEMKVQLGIFLSLVLLAWQLAFDQGNSTPVLHFYQMLYPLTLYFLISSALSLILFGKPIGKEIFQVVGLCTVVTEILFFISQAWFVSLSLPVSFFITCMPVLFVLLYRKEMAFLHSSQRRSLYGLAFFLPLTFLALYSYVDKSHHLILFWYGEIAILLLGFHFRRFYKVLQRKIARIRLSYLRSLLILFLGSFSLVLFVFLLTGIELRLSFLFLNLLVLLFGFVVEELLRLFKGQEGKESQLYLQALFLKRSQMAQRLLVNEDKEEEFSEFLHNDVLQSVIAIKNFSQSSSDTGFNQRISAISEELVNDIRARLDAYQPIHLDKTSLSTAYQELIIRLTKRYAPTKDVQVIFPDRIILTSPYDLLVYRMIEELVTNALKHGSQPQIRLRLAINKDSILLETINHYIPDQYHKGFGLQHLENRLEVLGGELRITKEGNQFLVQIALPIDKELCDESFAD